MSILISMFVSNKQINIMKIEFKKGDKVRLINVGDLPSERRNWIKASNLMHQNRMEEELEIGSELTVRGISDNNGILWLSFEENTYSQLAERFELV